jgi:hypothetical protein
LLFVGLLLVGLVGLAVWLGPIIIRDRSEVRAIKQAIDALPSEERDSLFDLIENLGNAPSRGGVGLFQPDNPNLSQVALKLPVAGQEYPWAGLFVTICAVEGGKAWPPVAFTLADIAPLEQQSRYKLDRYVVVPAYQSPTAKKASSVLSIDRYLKLSPCLKARVDELYPENPTRFLARLLSPNGKWEHGSGYDEVRFGLSAQYLQEYRLHKCNKCKRPMKLIVQMPGGMITSRLGDGTAYLFGCPSHPDETVTDYDMT